MQIDTICKKVKRAFENAGIVFDINEEDPLLEEYIEDSIQFVTSIVEIEKALGIEIPEEFLMIENMNTLNSFCRVLQDIINNT